MRRDLTHAARPVVRHVGEDARARQVQFGQLVHHAHAVRHNVDAAVVRDERAHQLGVEAERTLRGGREGETGGGSEGLRGSGGSRGLGGGRVMKDMLGKGVGCYERKGGRRVGGYNRGGTTHGSCAPAGPACTAALANWPGSGQAMSAANQPALWPAGRIAARLPHEPRQHSPLV
eukprot:235599-Chlamydomonas_euryale.AAC.1